MIFFACEFYFVFKNMTVQAEKENWCSVFHQNWRSAQVMNAYLQEIVFIPRNGLQMESSRAHIHVGIMS